MRATGPIPAACAMVALLIACGKHCEDVPGSVSAAERAWISYATGQTTTFVNPQGDTAVLTAGPIESRLHNGGGSKGECNKDYESLHQPLSGLDWTGSTELAVVHSRETGNAPGYVCGYYMDGSPANDIVVNGASYDNVYITFDSMYYFSKAVGLIKAGQWSRIP